MIEKISRDIPLAKMAEGSSENQFIGKFVYKQTKYGTTTLRSPKSRFCVKHIVTEKDTLMGIALKYGITVEQLKRENKLWTNDSLFLREFILIPVAQEDLAKFSSECEIIETEPATRGRSGSQHSTSNSIQKSESQSATNNENHENGSVVSSTEKDSKKDSISVTDILSKYDTSIASLKSNVQKLEKNTRYLSTIMTGNHDDPLVLPPRKSSSSHRHNSTSSLERIRACDLEANGGGHGYNNQSFNVEDSPVLMIKSRSSSKQVQTSIAKHERTNDEFFQL